MTETDPGAAARLIFGPDAASFQGDVDWARVDAGCDFGFEKVTQGTDYLNPRWAKAKPAMLARTKATGFVAAAYLFLEHGPSGAAQADWFASQAGDLTGFGIAIDAEPWYPKGRPASKPTLADATACASRLTVHYPAHPVGGYLPHWYWGDTDTTFVDWLWASRYVAGTGTPAELYARVTPDYWAPYGGRRPSLLQFSSQAEVAGVSGPCDVSAFPGTAADLAALILPAAAPLPPPPPADWQVKMMNRLPTMGQGDRRHWLVRRVQGLANAETADLRDPIAVDGDWGPETTRRVRVVQRRHKLPQTGGADPATWRVLVTGRP